MRSMKLFNDAHIFNLNEKNVLQVVDIINDSSMDELYDLSIKRLNDSSTYMIKFFTKKEIWDDILAELNNNGFEMIIKPNNIMWLREED